MRFGQSTEAFQFQGNRTIIDALEGRADAKTFPA